MKIRLADKDDVKALTKLRRKLYALHEQLDPLEYGLIKKPGFFLARELNAFIQSSDALVLVAEESGKIEGYLFGVIKNNPSFLRLKRKGRVGEIYLSESARGKKVGERLLKKSFDWFKKHGINTVDCVVDFRNKQSLKFFSAKSLQVQQTRRLL
ncbi:MAG: GNAT family N-acetyltransferase [Candidatus Micrarchaeia archaeon]